MRVPPHLVPIIRARTALHGRLEGRVLQLFTLEHPWDTHGLLTGYSRATHGYSRATHGYSRVLTGDRSGSPGTPSLVDSIKHGATLKPAAPAAAKPVAATTAFLDSIKGGDFKLKHQEPDPCACYLVVFRNPCEYSLGVSLTRMHIGSG